MHRSSSPQAILFAACDAATGAEFTRRLRANGIRILEAEPLGQDGADGNPTTVLLCPCKVAVVIGNRLKAIRIASELGRTPRPPAVILVADDVTAGEYDQLVNSGPVRYIYSLSEPVERIAEGVLAAVDRA